MRIAVIAAAILAAIPALAHSWYPLACCGNMDCFPFACDQLVETVSGWLYVPTGNLFTREQVQPSQDHHGHVCVGHGDDQRSIRACSAQDTPSVEAVHPGPLDLNLGFDRVALRLNEEARC
jgi:hypothetical protein